MNQVDRSTAGDLKILFDAAWYLSRYTDVQGTDPLHHFLTFGANEGRDPNPFFDGAWYRSHYRDVAESGTASLVHYLRFGAAELRNPHPRFDALWYAEEHPEAANNVLLYHMLFGRTRGWATEPRLGMSDFLPSTQAVPACPRGVVADVVIPVYRGLDETKRCLQSVLRDPARPPGRVIVVDDASPEPALSAWLDQLRATNRIVLLRTQKNQGFVSAANAGIAAAVDHDVALLNSDTEVPAGWLARLAGHAYARERIASVSPLSNNATICGYPSFAGGSPAFGLGVDALDEVAQQTNAGRTADVPTTVGFCMYIRRAALKEVGAFDAAAFGRGYGEEVDFCLRAGARGWRHALACDTYVYHEGRVSFLAEGAARSSKAQLVLAQRWPDFAGRVARHVAHNPAGPYRFALTAALFHRLGRPVILLISHGLGGGAQRQIDDLVRQTGERALFLSLTGAERGVEIGAPQMPDYAPVMFDPCRLDELAALLRSAGVGRVHVHHTMGLDLDVRGLIHRLGLPFDLTVHDYFPICPQVNLLPFLDGTYCREPGGAGCDSCIADRPSHGARDITSWRRERNWMFLEADRVICPSEDVRRRLSRYGLAGRAVVAPHQAVAAGPWPITMLPLRKGQKLRVALLGVLAAQKGLPTVTAVVASPDSSTLDLRLIGHPEDALPEAVASRLKVHGKYAEEELPGLLEKAAPHVAWFPAHWPETYSYTLSAAIAAGLPIVASAIGAFPERLKGRPLTWLVDPDAPAVEWIRVFRDVRAALLAGKTPEAAARPAAADFYASEYLKKPAVRSGLIDLRRPGRLSAVVVPERFAEHGITPCAYIRLVQPLDHVAEAAELDWVIADAEDARRYRADALITQRHAVEGLEAANALIRHARTSGMRLIYDLDDDLLDVPRTHPDAPALRPLARVVQRLVQEASTVWVSTPGLAARLAGLRTDARVVPNGLDERLWVGASGAAASRGGAMRVLFMGTATHDSDFAIVEPVLERLHAAFPDRLHFDMIGVSQRSDLPGWVRRPDLPASAHASYPGFVSWMCRQPGWDVGIAPLQDTRFTGAKSAIKAMDYAALGLAVVASDVGAYRDALGDDSGVLLVPERPEAWAEALTRLLRNPRLRRESAARVGAWFRKHGTLSSQREARVRMVREAVSDDGAERAVRTVRRRRIVVEEANAAAG